MTSLQPAPVILAHSPQNQKTRLFCFVSIALARKVGQIGDQRAGQSILVSCDAAGGEGRRLIGIFAV